MLGKTYDALIAAGAPEDKARDAAEELAEYETRFATMANDIALIKGDIVGIKRRHHRAQVARRRQFRGDDGDPH